MLPPHTLSNAFDTYWTDMDRCVTAGAYWALLHLAVCLPDICSALEALNGEATGARYIAWCDRYLPDPLLSGQERYVMRCKVLHQGRATTDQPTNRYVGFSFGQPSANGEIDHMRPNGQALNLDVGELAKEVRNGVNRWILAVDASPSSSIATNVERNLATLVQVRQLPFPVSTAGGAPILSSTLKTS